MKYINLGKSELEVSRICLGCMGFGDANSGKHTWTINEDETKKIIKECLEKGINFFDTAIAYQNGTSEKYVGNTLNNITNRNNIIVATKFLPRTKEDIQNKITGQKYIENTLNQSLKNLNMDYVDLYIYHMWDYNTPIIEILEGLNNVVKSGKVRYIGISNCYAYQLAKANEIAKKEGFPQFISVQGHYNLIFREEEREMLRLCKEDNIAITPYSPLAGGRLSKRPEESSKRLIEDNYAKLKYDKTYSQDKIIINRVIELAEKYGVSMTEISLAWLLTKSTSPIVGVTKLTHIKSIINSVNISLTNEDLLYLEECYIPHNLVGVMAENN